MSGGANDLEIVRRSKSVATSYSYTFKWGWAIFTVNDSTGEFSVQSDWGNWSNRWNILHLGKPTLTEFLKHSDADYVVNKFQVERSEIDEEATRKRLRELVIKARREKKISKEEAEDAVCEIKGAEFSWGAGGNSTYYFGEELDKITGMDNDPAGAFDYVVRRRPTMQYTMACRLFELFQADLRDGIDEVKASP